MLLAAAATSYDLLRWPDWPQPKSDLIELWWCFVLVLRAHCVAQSNCAELPVTGPPATQLKPICHSPLKSNVRQNLPTVCY
jgi:hypothetical protein